MKNVGIKSVLISVFALLFLINSNNLQAASLSDFGNGIYRRCVEDSCRLPVALASCVVFGWANYMFGITKYLSSTNCADKGADLIEVFWGTECWGKKLPEGTTTYNVLLFISAAIGVTLTSKIILKAIYDKLFNDPMLSTIEEQLQNMSYDQGANTLQKIKSAFPQFAAFPESVNGLTDKCITNQYMIWINTVCRNAAPVVKRACSVYANVLRKMLQLTECRR